MSMTRMQVRLKSKRAFGDLPATSRTELLLFLLIPVTIIGLMAALLWLPRLLAHPRYDFIYSMCSTYRCNMQYSTEDGSIASMPADASSIKYEDTSESTPDLFYFDVETGGSKQISEAKARTYKLSTSTVSPDGYRLVQGGSRGGFLFWGGAGDYEWYLRSGLKKKPVVLGNGLATYYNGENVTFLGWVEQR